MQNIFIVCIFYTRQPTLINDVIEGVHDISYNDKKHFDYKRTITDISNTSKRFMAIQHHIIERWNILWTI